MQSYFFYIVLENGLSFYNYIDSQFKNQFKDEPFQDELFGSLLFAFQTFSKHVLRSQICTIQLEQYIIIIHKFNLQNQSIFLIFGTDTSERKILNQFIMQFIDRFQSLIKSEPINLTTNEIDMELKAKIDEIYTKNLDDINHLF